MEAVATELFNFFTDRNFCCGKYPEFKNTRIYDLAGAELAEKGRIIQIISEIFAENRRIIFYSPYERTLPCAVYLPDFRIMTVSGCMSGAMKRLTDRTFDIGTVLRSEASMVEEIVDYTMNQSTLYMNKSIELLGISDFLLKEYIKSSTELLKTDKLRNYARRKFTSMISGRGKGGTEIVRTVSAITCGGYRFADLPENYSIILLDDEFMAASRIFVRALSATANKYGYDTIISRAVDSEHSPFHLIIPELRTVFISESSILKSGFGNCKKINFERFYIRNLMLSREHDIRFFGSYIRKMYNEAALYARICMDIKNQGRKILEPYISGKAASDIAAEIVSSILN